MGAFIDETIKPSQSITSKVASNPNQNVTKLAPVDPNQVYKGPGSILGTDLENAYWKMYGGGGGGGGGGGTPEDLSLSLAGRSKEFGDYQGQTTGYMSNLMKGATDTASGMFGQGVLNQMTGDNDLVVKGEIDKLREQFGGNENHPAFIKAKNEALSTARMFNARAYTDLAQKAGQYGLAVADMAKNYYDVYSTREEDQQKLKLATEQFNIETKLKQQQMAQSASQFGASMAMESQLAALAAISANRKFEIGMATEWATTELEARSADKVSMMNLSLERQKLDVAQATAKKQQSSSIWSSIFGAVGTIGGFLLGGPVGAAAGGALGSSVGKGV